MVKSIIAVTAAAVIAAVIVGLVPPPQPAAAAIESGPATLAASTLAAPNLVAPNLAAAPQTAVMLPAANAQSDKNGCTQAWPYYEQSCLRSGRRAGGNTRVVRIIANDKSVADRALRARRH
jgi:negative regulator of sigma E activity